MRHSNSVLWAHKGTDCVSILHCHNHLSERKLWIVRPVSEHQSMTKDQFVSFFSNNQKKNGTFLTKLGMREMSGKNGKWVGKIQGVYLRGLWVIHWQCPPCFFPLLIRHKLQQYFMSLRTKCWGGLSWMRKPQCLFLHLGRRRISSSSLKYGLLSIGYVYTWWYLLFQFYLE